MKDSRRIIILGAGPAGLSAGWELSKLGFGVVVMEKESFVGGQCATIEKDNYRFDFGGHRFITDDSSLSLWIKELMGDELITTNRKSQIILFNKYFEYPLEMINLARGISPFLLVGCLLDYFFCRVRKKLFNPREDSLQDWVVNRFGYTLYRIFFGMYSTKLWGVSPKFISSDWAGQRISLLNLWDIFLRICGKRGHIPKTYALEFLYPKLGIGRICERLADKIKENKGEVILNADIQQIIYEDGVIRKVVYKNDGTLKDLKGDFYISTIPLPEFIQQLYPPIDGKYLAVSRSMRFRSIRFMNIIFDVGRITENTWIYVPEPEYVFFRIQETKNWSPYLVPERDSTALILEIACFENDELWNKEEQDLFDICMRDLKKIGLINDNIKPVKFFSTRLEHAYPIYDIDYKKKVRDCLELVNGLHNVVSMGRQGLFRYNNMDHSIKMGLLTAENVKRDNLNAKVFNINLEKNTIEMERSLRGRE